MCKVSIFKKMAVSSDVASGRIKVTFILPDIVTGRCATVRNYTIGDVDDTRENTFAFGRVLSETAKAKITQSESICFDNQDVTILRTRIH